MAYSGETNQYGAYQGHQKNVNYPTASSYDQQAEVVAAPISSKSAGANSDYESLLGNGNAQPSTEQTGYRDLLWLVFFWVHAAVIVGLAGTTAECAWKLLRIMHEATLFAGWGAVQISDKVEELRQEGKLHPSRDSDDRGDNIVESTAHRLLYILFFCAFTAAVLAAGWVVFLTRCGRSFVKWTVILKFVLSFAMGIALWFITRSIVPVIICFILGCIGLLWYWCVRKRLAFAGANIEVGAAAVKQYPATIYTAIGVLLVSVLWVFVWSTASTGVALHLYEQDGTNSTSTGRMLQNVQYGIDDDGGRTAADDGGGNDDVPAKMGIVGFLLTLSFYWGMQVWRNVLHVTVAGTVGTWWRHARAASPTVSALKRAMTTSFGTIALGSLIIAFIQTLKAMVRNAKRRSSGGTRAAFAVLACCIGCIERLAEYFTGYAFVMAALYGGTFYESASRVVGLFKERGFTAIINDSLMDTALNFGMLLVAILNAGIGVLFGYSLHPQDDEVRSLFMVIGCLLGALFGLGMCSIVTSVIHSSVQTVFVCWAEAPSALAESHPEHFGNLLDAWMERYPDIMKQAGYDRYQRPGAAASVPVAAPVAYT